MTKEKSVPTNSAKRIGEFSGGSMARRLATTTGTNKAARNRCARWRFMLSPVQATMQKKRVLFLCTGNSCRSHMAEGLLRSLAGDRFEVFSAGAKPTGHVHPFAIGAMREAGIDISKHESKSVDTFSGQKFDYVITVCDNAREACPNFPGATHQLHWSFDDPAQAQGNDEQKMRVFRRVRDEIRHRIRRFIEANSQ
ncbi:MAG: arsenate reductase ArsC [Verrucomicrobiia bacterium]